MRKNPLLWISLSVLVVLNGCGNVETNVPELLEPVEVKLDMAEVTRGEIGVYTAYEGALVPEVEELYFTMDGYVDSIPVTYGDKVKKGDVLAMLDTEELAEQIQEVEEEIQHIIEAGEYANEVARINIEIARMQLTSLIRAGSYEPTVELKRAEIKKLEDALIQEQELRYLEIQEKERRLEELQEKNGSNKIVAPCDGTVVYLVDSVREGSYVRSYDPVMYVADDNEVYLQCDYISEALVEAADILYAQINDKKYDIIFRPYSQEEMLQMIMDEETIMSNFDVVSGEGELESGLYATVVTVLSHKDDVLLIPANALYRDEKGRYVYKEENGTRIRCEVEVGLVTDTRAEIISGVQEGDLVYVKD